MSICLNINPLRSLLTAGMCIVLMAFARPGAAGTPSDLRVETLPKSLEVALALSAAPPYLRSEASVYVLDPASGYVLERQGTNGFTCYVQRTDYTREDFNNGYIVPECQGPEGSKAVVPVEFDIERLRAEGKLSPTELKAEIERRFKTGIYHAPEHPGVAYMLSPVLGLYNGRSKTTQTMNMPHFMFFAPYLTNHDIGGGPIMGSYPYLISPGPMAYIIVHAGATERTAINAESGSLLKEACAFRQYLCIRGITPGF
jgi:hypothetical protein